MASRPQVSQALSDPNLLLFDADDQETTTADITTHLAALNLPSSSLPAFPHPTLSPSSSKLSLRGPPSPTGITIDMTGGSVKAYSTSPVGYHTGQQSFGQAAGDDLEGVSDEPGAVERFPREQRELWQSRRVCRAFHRRSLPCDSR